MFQWFRKKPCHFCQKKTSFMQTYLSDSGKQIKVCEKCLEYAERRALKKA